MLALKPCNFNEAHFTCALGKSEIGLKGYMRNRESFVLLGLDVADQLSPDRDFKNYAYSLLIVRTNCIVLMAVLTHPVIKLITEEIIDQTKKPTKPNIPLT